MNYEEEIRKNEEAKNRAIEESNSMYDTMITDSQKYYQDQIDVTNDYAEKQKEIQNQQTEQAINEIEQQKGYLEKDYQREQRGAYTDWQRESNRYGVNAEQQAASGLTNTGYSESSQVSMYNTYQNRVATARESYQRAVVDYDNAITNARLTNNAALAEIAYNALQTSLELSLQGFQYKNSLLQTRLNTQQELDAQYYNRYRDLYTQAEQVRQYNESLKEQQRQYNTTLAFQKQQAKQQQKNWEKEYALSLKASRSSGGSSGGKTGSAKKQETINLNGSGKAKDADAKSYYGTFSNGYQPKGITGHGKVSKTGGTVTIYNTKTKKKAEQNVWQTPDGKYWYWNGNTRKYVQYTAQGHVELQI